MVELNDPESLTAEAVATMSREDWNGVAFGVIELDVDMIVRTFNHAESSLSQRDPATTVGRHFFDHVAPCTDGPGFRGRIEQLRNGEEDRFDFEFAFPWGAQQVRVRALRLRESLWLMVKRIEEPTFAAVDTGAAAALV